MKLLLRFTVYIISIFMLHVVCFSFGRIYSQCHRLSRSISWTWDSGHSAVYGGLYSSDISLQSSQGNGFSALHKSLTSHIRYVGSQHLIILSDHLIPLSHPIISCHHLISSSRLIISSSSFYHLISSSRLISSSHSIISCHHLVSTSHLIISSPHLIISFYHIIIRKISVSFIVLDG